MVKRQSSSGLALMALTILALLAIIVITADDPGEPGESYQTVPPKPVSENSSSSYQKSFPEATPTAEQEAYIDQYFWPLLQDARTDYPVESVRLLFDNLIDLYEAKQVDFGIVITEGPQPAFATARVDDYGQRKLNIFLPQFQRLIDELGHNQELVQDIMLAVMLHEFYHLFHQPLEELVDATPRAIYESEQEAWWWTVEYILIPMRDQGRLVGLPEDDTINVAFYAWEKSAGDPNHTVWRQFSWIATGLPPEVRN